ncbi:MAG: hypothetical protein LBJ16_01390 [Holosporaceae bacterium]|jgi:hypothetical protein|nr:hypothetical protein [Holosporaceae bacterium]
MKQVITPEDLICLEEKLSMASSAPWAVVEETGVDGVWVTCSNFDDGIPVALFDYKSATQNKADAAFVVYSRNYMDALIGEVKTLRRRVLELIQLNNQELQKRMDTQTELQDLKKLLRDSHEPE